VTARHALHGTLPQAGTMGAVGAAALLANMAVFDRLWAYRHGDANMRSVWICSRNDVLGNLAVLLAAAGVFGTGTGWPDIIVAVVMASLALQGAWVVIRDSLRELREAATSVPMAAARAGVRQHHWGFGDMPARPHLTDEQITAIVRFVREVQLARTARSGADGRRRAGANHRRGPDLSGYWTAPLSPVLPILDCELIQPRFRPASGTDRGHAAQCLLCSPRGSAVSPRSAP
jgi:Cation efflux family